MEDDDRYVCSDCVAESYLRETIEKEGGDVECTYCEFEGKCITVDELAEYIKRGFEKHYYRTSTELDGYSYRSIIPQQKSQGSATFIVGGD